MTGNLTSSLGFLFLKSDSNFLNQAAKIPREIAKIIAKAPYKNGNSFDNLSENSASLFISVLITYCSLIIFDWSLKKVL